MRVTTAFKRLMNLSGVTVAKVVFDPAKVVVTLKLKSRKMRCPKCEFTTKARHDTRPIPSAWRHLDLGSWRQRTSLHPGTPEAAPTTVC